MQHALSGATLRMMSDLIQLVRSWTRRKKLQTSVAWLALGLMAGLGCALVLALLARMRPLMGLGPLVLLCLGFILICMAIAWVSPWLRGLRTPVLVQARRWDQMFGLGQRVSTALELHGGSLRANEGIKQLQVTNALHVAARIDTKRALPLRIVPRHLIIAGVMAFALLLALFLPNPQYEAMARQEALAAEKEEQAQQIAQLKELIENSSLLSKEAKAEALEALEEAASTLSDPNSSEQQTLDAMENAEQKLEEITQESSAQNDALEQLGQNLAPDPLTNDLADSLANRNFDQAAQELRDLTNQGSATESAEAQQRMASQLEQMARATAQSDPQLSQQLQQAAQNLREGNTAQAQEQLNQAAEQLQEASQQEQAAGQMEQAANSVNQARQQLNRAAGRPEQGQRQQRGEQAPGERNADRASGQGQPGEGQGGEGEPTDAAAEGNGNAQGGSGNQPPTSSQHSEDSGTSNEVYAPQRLSGGDEVQLEGKAKAAPNPNGRGQTGATNQSNVPYQQVYASYKKTADDALSNGEVPAELRDYVREYFSGLTPGQQPARKP